MQNSRTNKAMKNVLITTLCQIIYLLVSFICRTVFTRTLGAEYLGLNGLFSNVLTMLSFVELGIGSALVYKMYKPLAMNDEHMLCVYIRFYKKIYIGIAIIVAVIGLGLIPFLHNIVNAPDIDVNITFLYLLFLVDTIISYLYAYKKSILIADQKNYIVAIYTQIFNVIMNVGQIIILLMTHNFTFYLVFKIICDWLNNVFCSRYAEKKYPYINNPVKESISEPDKKELKENIKGLLLGKIASVAFDGTDNVFISAFVGVSTVGIMSNYTLILSMINSLLNQVFNSLTSSIGNLGVTSEKKEVQSVFKRIYFVNTLLYGYLFVGMVLLLRSFIVDIWVGKEYYLATVTVVLLVLELCLRGIHYPVYMTRTAMGLFHQLKYVPLMCAMLNIGLDFILGLYYGLSGIVLATVIARCITRAADIKVLYNDSFGISSLSYYTYHLKMLLLIFLCTGISYLTISLVHIEITVLNFIFKFIIVSIIYWGITLGGYWKTPECKYYCMLIEKKIREGRK